uniref:Uncharacterized protein LOC117351078 n=1 Tax=Geotrypetes seraphini TaxID=260995 RepID=A0A6P8PCX9_GEOSA|nr:uncharacterized protein LOC117351078 [Geotrypetes seraphini]
MSAMQNQSSSAFEFCFVHSYLCSNKQRRRAQDVQHAQPWSCQICMATRSHRSQKTAYKGQTAAIRKSVTMKYYIKYKTKGSYFQDRPMYTNPIKYFSSLNSVSRPGSYFQDRPMYTNPKKYFSSLNSVSRPELYYQDLPMNLGIAYSAPISPSKPVPAGKEEFSNIVAVGSQKYMIVKQSNWKQFELAAGEPDGNEGRSTMYYFKINDNKMAVAFVLKSGLDRMQMCYNENVFLKRIKHKDHEDHEDKYDQHLFIMHKDGESILLQCYSNKDLYLCVIGERIGLSQKNEQRAELHFEIES